MIPLITIDETLSLGGRIGALAALALLIGLIAAMVYRWFLNEELPQGIAILLGASAIAVVLNTTASLGQSIGGTTELLAPRAASFTVLAFLVGGIASEAGRLGGDRLGKRLIPGASLVTLDGDVTSFIKGRGRVIRVEVPEEIQDIDGYEPVRTDIKDNLSGTMMSFPSGLTEKELNEAFVTRVQQETGIQKIDVEFTPSGKITYLAVGRGEAGIGHTLPPGELAIAIRADPAFSASPGDQVRVWKVDPEPRRLLTAEVRGVVEDIVTISVPEDVVHDLEMESGYRLVTLPRTSRPDREFASVLRRENESIVQTTIQPSSDVVGRAVDMLSVTVLTIKAEDGSIDALPEPETTLQANDTVISMGRPDVLRRFEVAAQGTS